MSAAASSHIRVCLELTQAIGRTHTLENIYAAALDALARAVSVPRASILLFDPDGVMRFKAYRGLSANYRAAVEGHTPWSPHSPDPQPIVLADVTSDPDLRPYLPVIQAEGIAGMAFIPLVSMGRVIGKFMLYFDKPRELTPDELQLAGVIAAEVAFAIERVRAEEATRRSEERLRFALEAASMGTWDWDLSTNTVRWSENLERIHGLPAGTFDGSFQSYEQEIHPDDRERVLASARRAIAEGVPHDVEYRIVAPDGTIRWVEGKGRVEYQDGVPVRMSGICMMVTRRKEAELARLAAAEEANRLKDEFLATLSHELRTPLNAILGWLQMLQAENFPAERQQQAIQIIARNAQLQTQLIEDILDVSRIISGKLETERLPVMVHQLIEGAVEAVQPAARAKRVHVAAKLSGTLPLIEGDPKRLQQVLANVLSNSVKFTPEGGAVTVACECNDDRISIAVSDTGIGIEQAFLPYVFDRFRQADSRTTRKHGGLGLGLAIARHLVEQHGGTIRAASDGPDRGATFTIELPVGSPSHAGIAEPSIAAGRNARGEGSLAGRTVMLVDDQPDSLELLSELFQRWGARVLKCHSARAALDALDSQSIELLVADIAMPDVDGYELLRRVRGARAGLPALAVSAYAHPEDRYRALAAGFNGYCAKPVDAVALLRLATDAVAAS
jgi:PAS domain S-box-containing protein